MHREVLQKTRRQVCLQIKNPPDDKLLTRVKNPIPYEKKKGVYKVDCSCGNTYIGETGRTLDARLKEHQRAVKVNNRSNGIAVHVNNTVHDIDWDSTEVIDQEENWRKRKIKEALHIRSVNAPMNLYLDQGYQLNSIWSALSVT